MVIVTTGNLSLVLFSFVLTTKVNRLHTLQGPVTQNGRLALTRPSFQETDSDIKSWNSLLGKRFVLEQRFLNSG